LHQLAPDGVKALALLQAKPIAELKPALLQLWHEDRNLSPRSRGKG